MNSFWFFIYPPGSPKICCSNLDVLKTDDAVDDGLWAIAVQCRHQKEIAGRMMMPTMAPVGVATDRYGSQRPIACVPDPAFANQVNDDGRKSTLTPNAVRGYSFTPISTMQETLAYYGPRFNYVDPVLLQHGPSPACHGFNDVANPEISSTFFDL